MVEPVVLVILRLAIWPVVWPVPVAVTCRDWALLDKEVINKRYTRVNICFICTFGR